MDISEIFFGRLAKPNDEEPYITSIMVVKNKSREGLASHIKVTDIELLDLEGLQPLDIIHFFCEKIQAAMSEMNEYIEESDNLI